MISWNKSQKLHILCMFNVWNNIKIKMMIVKYETKKKKK